MDCNITSGLSTSSIFSNSNDSLSNDDSMLTNEPSVWKDVLTPVSSRPSSPTSTSIKVREDNVTGTLDGRTPVKAISPATDPNASLKLDIRARSVEVRAAKDQALIEQNNARSAMVKAEATWKATPFYHIGTRFQLYNASLQAQIKFNKATSFVRLEEIHVDYLDTLSKSELSPEEQHAKYCNFKTILADAQQKRDYSDFLEELNVGTSSGVQKGVAPRNASAKTEAAQAERKLRALLNEIQKPHAVSRHAIAQVLRYRETQLHQLHHANLEGSQKAQRLQNEIQILLSFQARGGLDAMSSKDANELNDLFKTAATAYKTFQKATENFNNTHPLIRTALPLAEVETAFEKADAAVMEKIRSLQPQGPPALRKELTTHLNHKEFLKSFAGDSLIPALDEEIATLKTFLASPQFATFNPTSKQAKDLTQLLEESNQKYAVWQDLETIAKAAQEEALKAKTEALETKEEADRKTATAESAPPATAPTTIETDKLTSTTPMPAEPAKKEMAAEKNSAFSQKEVKAAQETAKKAASIATEAQQKATKAAAEAQNALEASQKLDNAIITQIKNFLAPTPPIPDEAPTAPQKLNLPLLPKDDDPAEEVFETAESLSTPLRSADATPLEFTINPLHDEPPTIPFETTINSETAAPSVPSSEPSAPPASLSTSESQATTTAAKQIQSLLTFIRSEITRITSSLTTALETQQEPLKKQVASLQQFLTSDPDEASPEKVNILSGLMTKIQEKNQMRFTASKPEIKNLNKEIVQLRKTFIAALETQEAETAI